MKIAPLYHALKKEPWARLVIVHTGQHYDADMSDTFFTDLGLPKPDIYLGIGSGTHAEQTAKVMMAYEKAILEQRPDLIVVVGDVNSTMAVTLVASKIVYANNGSELATNGSNRPLVAHLEAGLRSFDRGMPEEINRLVTDVLSDRLWTPSPDANENLVREGISSEKIQLVGNIMIDSLEMMRERIESERTYEVFGLEPGGYCVATFHRPSNVDEPPVLKKLYSVLESIALKLPVVFPIHPRTRRNMERNGLIMLGTHAVKNLFLPEPLSYIRFMSLVFNCKLVVTDSGGVQEETSYLGIPCLTVRENTERPITLTRGTNQLCKLIELEDKVGQVLQRKASGHPEIEFWDGKTADRIVKILKNNNPF